MAAPIKISRQRIESETYWTPKKELGKPLTINVQKAKINDLSRREDSAEDVRMLKETLPKLGFSEPCVMADDHLNDKKKLLNELERTAQDDIFTKDADVFICIIMAFGLNNHIYLNNYTKTLEQGNDIIELSEIINVFKSDHCHGLICKPKIFIVHTDDPFIDKYDASRFSNLYKKDVSLKKIPVEADIMIYHSDLSVNYTKHIAKEEPGDYANLLELGLVRGLQERTDQLASGDTTAKPEEKPGTHFIFTLCNAAKILMKEGKFDMLKWVFLTNKAIKDFLDTDFWLTWRQGKWTREPRIPMCTIQLTKNITFDLTIGSEKKMDTS